MTIAAPLKNSLHHYEVLVETDGNNKKIVIPAKAMGCVSAINGGELLFTALATCFCNELYCEATKRKIEIRAVEVTVTGNF